MGRQSQDVVVRFVGDTGNLGKGLDDLQGRFRAVTGSIEGIAKVGAALGALSFFKTAIDEAREAARVTRQTEQVLRTTGGAAKVTAEHISELSGRLSELAGVDDEVIQHGANLLLTFTRVRNEVGAGNDVFDQAAQLSLDMSAAMSEAGDAGAGLQDTAIKIGKALNDPIKGMTALSKVGVSFTAEQKEQVKALVESGDILGAQKIVLAELKTEFGGMAAATADSTAKAQVGFANFAEEIGGRVMPAVNAISDWAVNSGIPALTKVAGTVLDVVIPAVKGIVSTGKQLIGFFADLPGPIQGAIVAMVAWKLMGDNVTGMFGRMSGPMKTFGADVRTVMTASGGDVGRFGASMQVLQDRIPTLGAMGAAFRTAKGDAEGFAGTLKGSVAGAFAGLKGAGSGLVSFLGGPWGVAIAAAGVVLGVLASRQQKAAAETAKHEAAERRLGTTLDETTGAVTKNTRLMVANDLAHAGMAKAAERVGLSFTDVVSAALGEADALGRLKTAIMDKAVASGVDLKNTQQLNDFLAKNAGTYGVLWMAINGTKSALTDETAAKIAAANATKAHSDAEAASIPVKDASRSSSDMLKDSVEALGGKFDDTKTQGQYLVDVIKGLTDAQTTAIDLEEGYEAALDGLTESIKTNKATLDIHTEAGRANRDALEAAATSIRDMTLADIESGVPAAEAIARHDRRTLALQEEARKLGLAKQGSQDLITKYSEIPKEVRTIISTQGAEETYQKLLDMNLAQQALAQGVSIRAAKGLFGNEAHGGRATGGEIYGPGGPKSDVIPIWASNGEFMQQASAVNYYGVPLMKALNERRIPKQALGYAAGGPVGWPFPVQTNKTKIPTFGGAVPGFAAAIPAGGGGGGGGAGVQRWAPMVLQILAMLGQSSALLPNVLRRMNQESGGNPNAINNWDSNAAKGTPSIGLMQTIGPTFSRWAGPYAMRGIYDPFANIYAGLNYAIHRYPSLQYAMDKPGGYKNGGWLQPGGLAFNETSTPEAVFNQKQLGEMGATYNLNVFAPVGSQRELENWFVKMQDKMKGRGRA